MKNILFLILITVVLCSCEEHTNQGAEIDTISKKLSSQATTDDVNSFDPPMNNSIKALLYTEEKKLKVADSIYRTDIEKSNAKAYYENLKQIGFLVMINHGLIEEGTKEQKEFYIKEQLNLDINLLNINNFYKLLSSCQDDFTKNELQDFSTRFYSKNKNSIEKVMKFAKVEDKIKKLEELNSSYEAFKKSLN